MYIDKDGSMFVHGFMYQQSMYLEYIAINK